MSRGRRLREFDEQAPGLETALVRPRMARLEATHARSSGELRGDCALRRHDETALQAFTDCVDGAEHHARGRLADREPAHRPAVPVAREGRAHAPATVHGREGRVKKIEEQRPARIGVEGDAHHR